MNKEIIYKTYDEMTELEKAMLKACDFMAPSKVVDGKKYYRIY